MRALGFDVVRVRHRGEVATIEVPPDEVDRLLEHRELGDVRRRVAALGWDHVRVDPTGYRPGGALPG